MRGSDEREGVGRAGSLLPAASHAMPLTHKQHVMPASSAISKQTDTADDSPETEEREEDLMPGDRREEELGCCLEADILLLREV